MLGLFKLFYKWLHLEADRLNRRNILESVAEAGRATHSTTELKLLDIGCDDGEWTLQLAKAAKTDTTNTSVNCFGIEIFEERAKSAEAKGINVATSNASTRLPYDDSSMDVIHSNQSIEHVPEIDGFVAEIFRVLKPGGTAVVSSENASAWHNIFASIMGWQIFSLTNVSAKAGAVGNPLALHRGQDAFSSTWTHKTIFNYRGFKEIFEVHGFEEVKVLGSGYHPLPAIFGKYDPRHAHFLTAKMQKPLHAKLVIQDSSSLSQSSVVKTSGYQGH